ncbi:MAG: tetratricopeptide repeat protein, partial [Methylococcaceae bacterium]
MTLLSLLIGCASQSTKATDQHPKTITVFPLTSASGDNELDLLSIRMQDHLTVDLWNVSTLDTHVLGHFGQSLKQLCPAMELSCISQVGTSAWREVAASHKPPLDGFISGEYQRQGNEIIVKLVYHHGAGYLNQKESIYQTELSELPTLSSKMLLEFLGDLGLAVKAEEIERVLSKKTNAVEAWKSNASGYWLQQKHSVANKSDKQKIESIWSARLTQAIEIDPNYAEALNNLGWYYLVKKKSKAQALFQNALSLKPDFIDSHIGLALTLEKDKKYVEAISHYERVVDLNRSNKRNQRGLANIYIAYAKQLEDLKDHSSALEYYSKALVLVRQYDTKEYTAEVLRRIAKIHNKEKDYSNAELAYREVLSIEETLYGKGDPRLIKTLTRLAISKVYQNKDAQAESIYRRTLAICEKNSPEKQRCFSFVAYGLGRTYYHRHEYKRAVPFLQRFLKIQKSIQADQKYISKALRKLAKSYKELKHPKKAVQFYDQALSLDEKFYGPEHAEVATDLSNLARLYRELGEPAQAITLYLRALSIREKIYGTEHVDVVHILDNLASAYADSGEYAQASLLYERALASKEKLFGSESKEVSVTLNNFALLYMTLGDYASAKQLLMRALTINEKVYGPEHANVATVLSNLGILYQKLGEYEPVVLMQKRALAIREETFGPEDVELVPSLRSWADLARSIGRYAASKKLYMKALAIIERNYGIKHFLGADILASLSLVHLKLEDYSKAKTLLRRSLEIVKSGNHPEQLWNIKGFFMKLYTTLKQPKLAIFFGKQAINALQTQRGRLQQLEDRLQKSFLENNTYFYKYLADILITQGRLPEAEQVLAMLKEEEYFDFIRRDSNEDVRTTQASYTPIEQEWKQRYDEIAEQLVKLGTEYNLLVQINQRSAAEEERFKALQADMDVAREAFLTTLDELDEAFSNLSAEQAKAYAAKNLEFLENEQETLANLQHGAVLIHTVLTEDTLHLLLTTPNTQIARKTSISAADLNQKI